MRFRLVVDGESHEVQADRRPRDTHVHVDGVPYVARVARRAESLSVRIGARRHRVEIRGLAILVDGVRVDVAVRDLVAEPGTGPGRGAGLTGLFEVRPPMPGRVVRLGIAVGSRVRRGDALVVLEAMKMQNEIPSPADAVVREVHVREGETIGADRLIAVLEAV